MHKFTYNCTLRNESFCAPCDVSVPVYWVHNNCCYSLCIILYYQARDLQYTIAWYRRTCIFFGARVWQVFYRCFGRGRSDIDPKRHNNIILLYCTPVNLNIFRFSVSSPRKLTANECSLPTDRKILVRIWIILF